MDKNKKVKDFLQTSTTLSDSTNNTFLYVLSDDPVSSALHVMKKNNRDILSVLEGSQLIGHVTLKDIMAEFSPERIYVADIKEISDSNTQKHISRYKFSSMFIKGGTVLDCACGSGYGSKIISQKADKVYGIDISIEGIEFAKKNNQGENIEYRNQPLQDIAFEAESLQAIISLETLEHISKEDMTKYLNRASGWLSPGGCFIGSSPMLRYHDGKPFITNPYHINELPKAELIETVLESFHGFTVYFFYQNEDTFEILDNENTGFCIFVARKTGKKC